MANKQNTSGRGPIATEDMRRRVASGWTVSDLWDRHVAAVTGDDGYSYEYVERLDPEPSKVVA